MKVYSTMVEHTVSKYTLNFERNISKIFHNIATSNLSMYFFQYLITNLWSILRLWLIHSNCDACSCIQTKHHSDTYIPNHQPKKVFCPPLTTLKWSPIPIYSTYISNFSIYLFSFTEISTHPISGTMQILSCEEVIKKGFSWKF